MVTYASHDGSHLIKKVAIVTGASTGIGYELSVCCARDGYDLLIVADEQEILSAADRLPRPVRPCRPSTPRAWMNSTEIAGPCGQP